MKNLTPPANGKVDPAERCQRDPCGWIRCSRNQCQTAPAPISTAAAPISTGKTRAAHGDDLPDLPGLGGVGLPDEQRTARPITCPNYSFQPDPAAALMTPPPCCPHPCQTYRQRQPPARQHPAAGPTPEGSDSPPNGIEL